ncbi:MAG TPA: hypothetical protein VFQ39_03360 [Longimicrobium sp.]|nr:hypothetical protein [Longimicrobium sp.]
MRLDLYDAIREETGNRLDPLAELAAGDGWIAILARSRSGGDILVLLQEDGEGFDLSEIEALDSTLELGATRCVACGAVAPGWPRLCGECGRDLFPAARPGLSRAQLVDEVRDGVGEYEVLGAMWHEHGGGPLFFVRDSETGALLGLTLDADAADEGVALVVSWRPDPSGEAGWNNGYAAAKEEPPVYNASPPVTVGQWGDDGDEATPPSPFTGAGARRRREGSGPRRYLQPLVAVLVLGAGTALAVGLIARYRAKSALDAVPGDSSAQRSAALPVPPSPATTDSGETPINRPPAPAPPADLVRPAPPPSQPGGEPVIRTVTGGGTPRVDDEPADSPAPEARPADDAAAINAALSSYARAVESRQTSRIRRAYPGITPGETTGWETRFRELEGTSNLSVEYVVRRGPDVTEASADVVFILTISYTDPAGRRVSEPMPLRATLERTSRGWSLQRIGRL